MRLLRGSLPQSYDYSPVSHYGFGSGSGSGSGDGSGFGDSAGYGYGSGFGDGYGYGDGKASHLDRTVVSIERFTVERKFSAYYVYDTQHRAFNLPEMACSLYFETHFKASEVAVLLNKSWRAFLRNPQ